MTARHWSDREPDEDLADWMLRIQISTMAVAGLIRVPAPEPERSAS